MPLRSWSPSLPLLAAAMPSLTLSAQLPQHTVIPAAYASADAVGMLWVAGSNADLRQQTLIGASHLTALLGQNLQAIELRRSVADETNVGGSAHLAVTLSTSPRITSRTSRTYADNVGNDAVQVFAGVVTIPTSPPELGPNVAWSTNNTVRIAFQTPFVYTGGTLCVDVIGTTIPGQESGWWVADAISEIVRGTAVSRGQGCGTYGGNDGSWSDASTGKLVPGSHTMFWAYGTPNGLAMAAFGTFSPLPIPLTALGLPSPGCSLHLLSLDVLVPTIFQQFNDPILQSFGGEAWLEFWIPDDAAMFGLPLSVQWFDFGQLASSNAMQCTIASTMHALDMSVVEGPPSAATGNAALHIAHVMRFEHQ